MDATSIKQPYDIKPLQINYTTKANSGPLHDGNKYFPSALEHTARQGAARILKCSLLGHSYTTVWDVLVRFVHREQKMPSQKNKNCNWIQDIRWLLRRVVIKWVYANVSPVDVVDNWVTYPTFTSINFLVSFAVRTPQNTHPSHRRVRWQISWWLCTS